MRLFWSFILSAFVGIAALALAPSSSHAVPTLLIDGNGQLTGANNVDLGTRGLFDVVFRDGTCSGLFSGCDNAADDFAFQNIADATAASAALLNQVFLDFGSDLFDTNPALTAGCADPFICEIITPFALPVNPSIFSPIWVGNTPITDGPPLQKLFFRAAPTSISPTITYAIWTEATTTTPVPEPTILGLFAVGLIGLAVTRRQRRLR